MNAALSRVRAIIMQVIMFQCSTESLSEDTTNNPGNAAAAGKWGKMEWKEWESTKEKRKKENKVQLSSAGIKPNASKQSM